MDATLVKEMSAEETEGIYRKLCDYVNSLSFGYFTEDPDMLAAGADLAMLKEFYSVQDALYTLDMPKDDFFTVEWFAEKEGLDPAEAKATLIDMAKRGIVYREKQDDGVIRYHNAPAAHGIFEFHAGDAMNAGWLGPLFGTLGTGTLQVCYDAGVPFYRTVPLSRDVVRDGDLLPDDDIFANLKNHRRFCLSPCACLDAVRDNLGQHNCDHPKGVCIQTDEMADYYLDDLNLGVEVNADQVEAILKKSIDNDLCIQTTYAKKNEIICECNLCHCGILPALKNWPGDAASSVTNYRIEFNKDACKKHGICAEKCPMYAIEINEEGYPVITDTCIGCGQCVLNCPEHARILVRKDEVVEYPDTVWETYAIMEDNRRRKGRL